MQVEKESPALLRGAIGASAFPTSLRSVHVVGLGGSGLRGIVRLLHERGVKVTGSELSESPVLETFRRDGIECRVGHSSGNLAQDTNLVVISAAVADSNPEVQAAKTRRIPVLKYAECLGQLMAEKEGIAVAGTHGKTTTTAMVAFVLSDQGLHPSFVVGGEHPALGGSSRWGRGPHFVAEACEFDRSFLNLRPKISVVTNVEEDHLDYFESLKDIQHAFAQFVSLLPEDGFLVINRDDANSGYLREFCRSSVGTFSLQARGADWWAEAITPEVGGTRFRIVGASGESAEVRLHVPGIHNVSNALATTVACRRVGLSVEAIAASLGQFVGVRRRFDVLHRGKVMVVDDYAHHPTEIHSVLRAARQSLAGRRLLAVFQPHQHSRLKKFRMQFADVLSRFDVVVVTDVFRARDTDEDAQLVQSSCLVSAIRDTAPEANVIYAPGLSDVMRCLDRVVRESDVVLFMGAGTVTDMAKSYAERMSGS